MPSLQVETLVWDPNVGPQCGALEWGPKVCWPATASITPIRIVSAGKTSEG